MTGAEVRTHPGSSVVPTYAYTEGKTALKVTQVNNGQQPDDDIARYTGADMLTVAVAAYERGLMAARTAAGRDHWNNPDVAQRFRENRIAAEVTVMKRYAQDRYLRRGYPPGYDYRGGPVCWETGMPAGSACAWVRRARRQQGLGLAA